MSDASVLPGAGRRVWASVVALAVAETVSWGVLFYSFGVLLPAMEADLGLGRTTLTALQAGALFAAGLMAAPVGRALDRRGARPVMTAGAVLAALLVAGWSQAGSWWSFGLVWLGLGVAQALVLYEPAFVGVTAWIEEPRERARALLVITLLGGLASTVFLPLTGALIEAAGWRGAVLWLAAILAVVTIPIHATLPRGKSRTPGRAEAPGDGGRGPEERPGAGAGEPAAGFGWLTAAFALHSVIAGAMAVHAVPLITEAGREPVRAAAMVGLFGLFQVAGRLVSSVWWMQVPERWRVAGLVAGQGVAMVALILAEHDAAVWVFVVSFGTSNGLLTLARPLAVAEWQGTAKFGAVSGKLAAWAQTARALAPLLASLLHAATGGYRTVCVVLALVAVGGAGAARMASVRRRWPGGRDCGGVDEQRPQAQRRDD